jgi:hypothetical protein
VSTPPLLLCKEEFGMDLTGNEENTDEKEFTEFPAGFNFFQNSSNLLNSSQSRGEIFIQKEFQERIDRWQQEEKLSLELVHQLLENDKNQNESKKRKSMNDDEDDDDELIAKLLQDELDEELEEERRKKLKVNENEDAMHTENRDAIEYVCQSVLKTNDDDRRAVMENLHCNEAELDRIIDYLIACPKIIHFHPDRVLQFFVDDDQYRNQFETNTSSGTLNATCRRGWENNLFGSSYSDEATGIRPKYGVLMYNGYDMNGCPAARSSYGDSYLVLQNVEDRVTYCYGDSGGHGMRSNASEALGYGCWLARILRTIPKNELQFLRRMSDPSFLPSAADLRVSGLSSSSLNRLSCYIEIQVHGSILFKRDVSMICLASKWKSVPHISSLAEEFCLLNPGVYLNFLDE